jgi:hypothetical protein
MPIIEQSSDNQMIGDNPGAVMESFSICPHAGEFHDSEKDGYKKVHHRCRYADMNNRCIRDHCMFDAKEAPKQAHRHWIHCMFCGAEHSIDPRQMTIPVCDKCLALFQEALNLPFTCMRCGKSQKWPSKAIFSRLCDDCWKTYMFNDCCKWWDLKEEIEPSGHDCLP